MSPLDRLLAEELPTGTFGGARHPAAHPSRHAPGPDPQAAAHVAVLLAALQPARRPRLRVVGGTGRSRSAA